MTARTAHLRRHAALLTLLLLTSLAVALPAIASHGLANLPGSGFEIDDNANLKVDHAGLDDWANVSETRKTDSPSGKNDDSYTGGAKEDDTCPGVSTGSIPPNKSDLLTFGLHEEAGDPGFLHLFWHRVQEPSGTTLMDFELNQSDEDCGNGVNPVRTPGDLLIEYRIEQGGARAAIFLREWTAGGAWGTAREISASNDATGTINSTAIAAGDADGLGAISPRTFGEATIDLDVIFDSEECVSFGSAMLKSRSSTSFTSALKDFIAPVPIELSNCGSVRVDKVDDAGNAVNGAEFTLYTDNAPVGTLGAEDAVFGTCTTVAGTCTISDVLAGDYALDETVVPSGYAKDGSLPRFFSVSADQNAAVNVVNPRDRGSILVEKVDESGDPLEGAGFTITPGDVVMEDLGGGIFCADGLLFDEYTVTETTTPPGYQTAAPQDFEVDSASTCDEREDDDPDLSFENVPQPGSVEVLKVDDDDVPIAGVTFELRADAGDDTPTGPVLGSCETGQDGSCTIENVSPGDYCVEEAGGVPAGYTPDDTPQCFTVDVSAGGDVIELTFTNPQTHKVIVLVCHEGTGTLAPSDVTAGSDSLTTLGASAIEEQLCELDGFGGLEHGDLDVEVDVGSDAH